MVYGIDLAAWAWLLRNSEPGNDRGNERSREPVPAVRPATA
jgi:hypothetical protein